MRTPPGLSGYGFEHAPHVEGFLSPLGEADTPNTWLPQDLGPVLDGTYTPEVASLLVRDDGRGLLYPGRTHSIHADSESGKSWLVQSEVARQLNNGQEVAYIDFESDAASVTRRLLDLGADREAIRRRFHYLRPEVAPAEGTPEYGAWQDLLKSRYALVVLDGVTEAMDLLASRLPTQDLNERIATFLRRYPGKVADRTGAAVVLIDHVVKSTETRGRHAIGGQHKLAGLSGAAYTVEVKTQPRPGHVGELRLYVAKDRPGAVRQHCPPPRADRLQLAAVVRIDSTGPTMQVTLQATDGTDSRGTDNPKPFRPTCLMERASRWLEDHPGEHARTAITDAVQGKRTALEAALEMLAAEGFASVSESTRGATTRRTYRHVRLYTEADDTPETPTRPTRPAPVPDPSQDGTPTDPSHPSLPLTRGRVDRTGQDPHAEQTPPVPTPQMEMTP